MILDKLKNAGLVFLAMVAVSFGVKWGFSFLLQRSISKKRQKAMSTTLANREKNRKVVENERIQIRRSDPAGLDSLADVLFP